ncbi:MAG: class I SAM-dependent methyltransferase, partial [Candidatus Acidiferrales bacterium]
MPPSAPPSPAPGTQPEGIREERAAASYVREMFSRIAPRYDLLNHLLSLNLDKLWRGRTARRFAHILTRGDAQVLDLCCGTGDLALALADVAVLQQQGHTRDAAHAAGTHAATDPLSCHSERSEESAFRTEAGQSKSNGGAQSSTELHRGATIWGSDFA